MCMKKTPWQQAVEFHGHACPGLAIGYKAVEAAVSVLGNNRDVDEEMVAVVENDSCSVDAIQSLLGCTVGKGNLIMKNIGKQVYTIGARKSGKVVRIALKPYVLSAESDESRDEKTQRILEADIKKLFNITEVKTELPKRAVIFKSVICSVCGEGVMEPKVRIKDGASVCLDCFEEYTRDW
jgi:formylmethanofuran dehydrogenase subunit E